MGIKHSPAANTDFWWPKSKLKHLPGLRFTCCALLLYPPVSVCSSALPLPAVSVKPPVPPPSSSVPLLEASVSPPSFSLPQVSSAPLVVSSLLPLFWFSPPLLSSVFPLRVAGRVVERSVRGCVSGGPRQRSGNAGKLVSRSERGSSFG